MKSTHTSLAILFCAFVFSFQAEAQYITNFAGNGYGAGAGVGGRKGDGGAAYAAELFNPTGVATYGYVNVYIADRANHLVRKVDHKGIISTLAGNDTVGYTWGGDTTAATASRMSSPYGVVADGGNNVYISDYDNNVIYRVSNSGILSTVAGNDTAGYTGDGGLAIHARLHHPLGITLDAASNLYIADAQNNVIRKVDAVTGIITTVVGTGYGAGLSLGHGDYKGDGGPATAARLNWPESVAIDYLGNMYIADASNNVIRTVNTAKMISTYAGTGAGGFSGDGGLANAAKLLFPSAVAADLTGNVYIADQGNNNIRKVTKSDGIITTIAGNHASGYNPKELIATASQLNAPTGLAVDGNGIIYVADKGNNVIRLLGPASIVNSVNNIATSKRLNVYPNPSKGSFTIEVPETASGANITITDMVGKLVATKTLTDTKAQKAVFNLDGVPAGNYVVKVSTSDHTYREKIQVLGQ